MIELDPDDVRVGLSLESMERRALGIIAHVYHDGNQSHYHGPEHPVTYTFGYDRVCNRTTEILPHGCWDRHDRSPYASYGDERWCDACIAYAALNGTLPRPEQTINLEGKALQCHA